MKNNCIIPGSCCKVWINHTDRWCDACKHHAAAKAKAAEPAPKFAKGQPVTIDDKRDLRHGMTVLLVERRLGEIAGRPYWIAALDDFPGSPRFSVTEDSLKPAEMIREPVIPTLEERRAKLRAESARLAKEPSPFVDSPQDHDGQANTSGEKVGRETYANTPYWPGKYEYLLTEPIGPNTPRIKVGDGPWNSLIIARPATPSTLTIVEGVERWRMIDPANRRAWTQGTGHTIEVHVTVQPSLVTHHTKFHMGDSAENVINWLDGMTKFAKGHPHAEISATVAKSPAVRCREDTGEIDP